MINANQNINQVLVIKEKALQIVRSRGPLLPVQITKELGINVMFASALLSELVDKKVLKLSNTKVGGSPVYYVTGQEAKLQALRDKLNDKQQKAFDMLKQQKILRDSEQEPVIRASLRDIKDFAHQLQVSAGNVQEIFWKWYLVPDSEAEILIKQKLGMTGKTPEHTNMQQEVQRHLSEIEYDLKQLESKKEEMLKPAQKQKEEFVRKVTKPRKIEDQQVKEQKPAEQASIDETDKFMMQVLDYFKQNKIEVLSVKQIRKNLDFESLIEIPSAVGSISYFCKAKNKQKVTDADLSLLFVQSQIKKMPILFVTTGELTKKAQQLLTKEFKNITIHTLK